MTPLKDQVAEVRRELAFRARVYGGLVARGKMTQADANKHTRRMQDVLATLESLEARERLL